MNDKPKPLISVVAPAFNEEESIVSVVSKWIATLEKDGRDWEIVLVNDGSTDRTVKVLDEIDEPRLRVISLEHNMGYGAALGTGLKEARGQYVFTLDSDGQFDLAGSWPLLEKLKRENLDLVSGYRRRKNDVWIRVIADRVLKLIVRAAFRLPLQDTNCAQRVMTREVAHTIPIEAIGFPTPTEFAARTAHMGYAMGEDPVDHFERAGGQSKLRVLQSTLDFLAFLAYLRMQLWLKQWRVIQL